METTQTPTPSKASANPQRSRKRRAAEAAGGAEQKDEDGKAAKKKASGRKGGKKESTAAPIRLRHRPLLPPFPTMMRRLAAPADGHTASHWARAIIHNGPLCMRCTALVIDEPAPQVLRSPGSPGACALLAAHLAAWLVANSAANVPHSPVLDHLLADVDRQVETQGSQLDTRHIEYIVAHVRPLVKIVAQIRTFLPPSHSSPDFSTFSSPTACHTNDKTFTGSFDVMWNNVISQVKNATYIVHWSEHFFVLRIDTDHKFWLIDTSTYAQDPLQDRAFIMNLGVCTSFFDSRDPKASLKKDLNGKDACKLYFKEFRVGRAIEERFEFDFKHNHWADLSPNAFLQAVQNTTTEEALQLRKITFYPICATHANGKVFLDLLSRVVS